MKLIVVMALLSFAWAVLVNVELDELRYRVGALEAEIRR